jgi:hypothetical protein
MKRRDQKNEKQERDKGKVEGGGGRTSAVGGSGFQDLVAAQTQLEEGGCSASIPRELSAQNQHRHTTAPLLVASDCAVLCAFRGDYYAGEEAVEGPTDEDDVVEWDGG